MSMSTFVSIGSLASALCLLLLVLDVARLNRRLKALEGRVRAALEPSPPAGAHDDTR